MSSNNPYTTVNTQLNIHNHGFPISADELRKIKEVDPALIPVFVEYVQKEQQYRHKVQMMGVENDVECTKIASKQLQDESKLRLMGLCIFFVFSYDYYGLQYTAYCLWV